MDIQLDRPKDNERQSAPLMEAQGGRVEQVWQVPRQDRELHLLAFAHPAGFQAFSKAPRRVALFGQVQGSWGSFRHLAVKEITLSAYFGDKCK
ncbi:MAG: hypothetical protein A2527_12075 [Candidatus Lambdaproteobacteria bacterium RIFOXYD2_FULL_50_16]|uniref:Uncharacterized protein n=1 Tax=Candidatus Lambdaproteobacteria bacterium RIFOXYD2_FULL_50_16 TaxID=1817772 RepID=A0A1F6GD68_9PROT|nr:MAG: hypothetical protein A2527_12075 [Candidatus Lambdaproteobacteria bacterium RIFOXYD2_FULL_50_16]